ncbi:twin-arginine translocase subunit TatE [Nissabacter sp. SGAir0207]|uniref:twin-arginine translocase subunit TatE n=1 Tax=Nissabacter sp. SGAir0207 TaxID=2126321 RepID=UPI0010CCB7A9|nr:twin-arginine translocase subunit TatE [Nissabacter sp. SGAir0207]QCR36804.1 twin-arginine translocase subunit TatE [Nissabacter sp. SGAir0207]
MEGISITKLLVIGVLIILLFGTSKLRSLGGDLGAALKGFKKAMSDDNAPAKATAEEAPAAGRVENKE